MPDFRMPDSWYDPPDDPCEEYRALVRRLVEIADTLGSPQEVADAYDKVARAHQHRNQEEE